MFFTWKYLVLALQTVFQALNQKLIQKTYRLQEDETRSAKVLIFMIGPQKYIILAALCKDGSCPAMTL